MSKIHKNTQNDYIKIKPGKRPQFKRGNPGKPKGAKNKFTSDIKEMVMSALNDPRIGGEEDFVKWIEANKRNRMIFYSWLMKMLPSNVNADISGDLGLTIKRIISDERPPE